ncbi:MAG: hypothetical protein C0599_13770 [Salinivirgaceae bacterium]|nr:MAG: hypothetical protein C0599_13770 [Salinivirgaceae bacterium]
MDNQSKKRNTIFRQLLKNLLLPVLVPFIIISVVYVYRNQSILKSYGEEKKYILVEKLTTLIEFEDIALTFLEEEQTKSMKAFSDYLVNEKFRNTSQIENANLQKIRQQSNVDFDIYIINQSGEIINTTFENDLGFNLFNIDEGHKKFLINTFKNGIFVSERLSLEASTGRQKKYTYHPTLDKKYIIELGSYSPKATHLIHSLNEAVEKLVNNKKLDLIGIDLFISKENRKSFISDATIEPDHVSIFNRTFETKEDFDTVIRKGNRFILYEYVHFSRENTDLYNESVLRIISDITNDKLFVRDEMLIYILVIAFTIGFLIIMFYYRAKNITRPIRNLVAQIKKIESGNFQGNMKVEGTNEIADLSEKFNSMTNKLSELYSKLENKVKERTLQLEEQKKELEKQATELEKLSIVASETDNVVVIMDKNGRFEWVNKAFEKTYGSNLETIIKDYGPTLFDISNSPNIQDIFNQLTEDKMSVMYKSFFVKSDNERVWTHTSLTPVLDQNKDVTKIIGLETDITQLVEIEDELIKAKQEAENANEAKSDFLANMSHEIRTPMNSIIGFSELLNRQIDDPNYKSHLESIISSANSLLSIINDILDLSKIEAGKIEIKYFPVNIHDLLEEIKNIFIVRTNEKALDLILELDPLIPEYVLFDEVRLRQILINLVGNAVKFTHQGYVKIIAKHLPLDQKSECDLQFLVEDTGIGINPDAINKIFDPFVQQDSKRSRHYQGTGLGLSIAKRFITMLNGTINVESTEKKGSTFEVYFKNVQITSAPVQAIESDPADIENIHFEKATILIVDDIEKNRNIIKESFQKTQITVHSAENGKVALDKMNQTNYDLVLMDIRMPVMDGYEATKFIKENKKLKHIPVVALTASGMTDDLEKISTYNFDGLLIKPVYIRELFAELAKHLKTKLK